MTATDITSANGLVAENGIQRLARADAWEFDMIDQEPRLVVEQGETFLVECNDAFCGKIQSEDDLPTKQHLGEMYRLKKTNPCAGPIYVKGAEPGDVLVVEVLDITVSGVGYILLEEDIGPLSQSLKHPGARGPQTKIIEYLPGPSGTTSDGQGVYGDGVVWDLQPMIGTMATVRDRPSVGSDTCRTQCNFGGNLDCREVKKGNRMYYPVAHEGGLLYLGDLQATQATEFGGTALETDGEVLLRCTVIKNKSIPFVRIETPTEIIQLNSHRPIDEGIKQANFWMLDWLVEEYGMTARDATFHLAANPRVRNEMYSLSMWGPTEFTVGVAFPRSDLPKVDPSQHPSVP